ncbi:uncharacterized protein PG998_010315 [Apiospora kogelbergensis]|uniref:uncharacterized protein n=1 Tax=Apiospora kogelbergensis TaxID=1337665 RepID=UPI003130D391
MEPLIERDGIPATEVKPARPKHNRSFISYCFKTDWWLENGCSILSVLFLMGMIILLAHIDGQPLSNWPFAVSPNAFISVLSTASKACLIQPVSECLGQLKWLHILQSKRVDRITKLQDFDNASRGPLGSLHFFFTRPTKSLMPYLGCIITLAAIATDPFAQQILSFGKHLALADGVHSELRTSQYVYSWNEDAIISLERATRLSLDNEPQLPNLSCTGFLCKYPPFASLGVASECQDVARRSQRVCYPYETGRNCTFTTPIGFQLQTWQMAYNASLLPDYNNTVASISTYNYSNLFEGGPLQRLAILMAPIVYYNQSNDSQIFECTIKLYAIEYTKWNTTYGIINPGRTKTFPPAYLRGTVAPDAMDDDDLANFTVTDPGFNYQRKFGITSLNILSIVDILDANLIVNEWSDWGDTAYAFLSNSHDIPATVNRVTAGLSYQMIDGPNATVTPVPVWNDVITITVHWAWISLPVTLVLAACLFLLVIVYQTHHAGHLIWKSSLTPLLLLQESYPLLSAGDKPVWTQFYLKKRTAVIANHLTQ